MQSRTPTMRKEMFALTGRQHDLEVLTKADWHAECIVPHSKSPHAWLLSELLTGERIDTCQQVRHAYHR